MSDTKFTPGPWYVVPSHDAKRPVICRIVDKVIRSDSLPSLQTEEADSNLIAAAPELYEALEMAMEIGDQCSRGFLAKFQRKARDAMAKARGES